MACYWFKKYAIYDRSINEVDYVPIKDRNDIKLPVASLCLDHPFSKPKFNGLDHMINETTYLEYLNGSIEGIEFENVDYQKLTLNIGDYFIGGKELWINETGYRDISLSLDHITTFNGFYYGVFMKCFSIRIANVKQNHIKELILIYDRQSFANDWTGHFGLETMSYSMHYPGQFLLGELNIEISVEHPLKIFIKEIEILRRRNERNKKCIENSNSFDRRVVNEYIRDKGCRPIYLDGEDQSPLCRSMEKHKRSRFEYATIRSIDIVPDCQVVSKLEESQKDWVLTGVVLKKEKLNSTVVIQVIYPDKIKIITSSKEIDIHTLIGNIGGYLGLLLGNIVFNTLSYNFIFTLFYSKICANDDNRIHLFSCYSLQDMPLCSYLI